MLAPTPLPVSVRGLALYATWYDLPAWELETLCARSCKQTHTSCEILLDLCEVMSGEDGSGDCMER